MIAAVLVTVLIDGAPVEGSASARLCRNVVVAPLAPYLRAMADRIELDDARGRIVIARGNRTVSLEIGSPMLLAGTASEELPIAPYLRAGEALIPLAATVRALGATVDFDASSKTMNVSWTPAPLVSLVPDLSYTPPPAPLVTFTPNPTPAPRTVSTGVPMPRRTPILVDHGDL